MSDNIESIVFPEALPQPPKLVPIAMLTLEVEDPDSIYTTKASNRSLSFCKVINGKIFTIPNKSGKTLEVNKLHGADNLTSYLDTGVSTLACRLYGVTPKGSGVYVEYGGIVKLSDRTLKVVSNQENTLSFEDSSITSNLKFEFDDSAEDEFKWASQESLIGKGRFTRDSKGKLYVQYIIHTIEY